MRLREVAEIAGVSVATVSRALNSETSTQVARQTRERVWQAARTLGYGAGEDADAVAASADTGATHMSVGLILDEVDDLFSFPFWLRVLAGIEKELIRHQCHVLFSYTADEARNRRARGFTTRTAAEGFIYVNNCPPLDDVPSACIVTVDGNYRPYLKHGLRFDHVGLEMRYGMYQMVDHLVGLGRRRFAYLGPGIDDDERTEAVHQGLARRGLSIVPNCDPVTRWTTKAAYAVAFELLSRSAKSLDALVCASDEIAIGAMRAAKKLGIRLADDLAITGFNDEPFARDLDPALTTLRVPKELVGELAAKRLLERLTLPGLPTVLQLLPATLVVRASCGA